MPPVDVQAARALALRAVMLALKRRAADGDLRSHTAGAVGYCVRRERL